MIKEFKVLDLIICDKNKTGQSSLLAKLSEMDVIEIESLHYVVELYSTTKWVYFDLDLNSEISNYLFDNTEERKLIDMSLYKVGLVFLDGKIQKVYKVIPPRHPDPKHPSNVIFF